MQVQTSMMMMGKSMGTASQAELWQIEGMALACCIAIILSFDLMCMDNAVAAEHAAPTSSQRKR